MALSKCLLLLLLFPTPTSQSFNLFISGEEMNRTMGILAEMKYVEKGKVNQYSTKFPYRINANTSHVNLSWNSMVRKHPISYSIKAVSEDFNVVPIIHIPLHGFLPLEVEQFSVEHRCTGSRAGQFQVQIHFNISWPSTEHPTSFILKQEKICALGNSRGRYMQEDDDFKLNLPGGGIQTFPTPKQVLLISLGVSTAFFLCIVLLIWSCMRKETNRKRYFGSEDGNTKLSHLPFISEKLSTGFTSMASSGVVSQANNTAQYTTQQYLLPTTSTPRSSIGAPPMSAFFNYSTKESEIVGDGEGSGVNIQGALADLYVDRKQVTAAPFTELEGTFGEVRFCLWQNNSNLFAGCDVEDEELTEGVENIPVYSKTLKPTADHSQFQKFLSQALVFHNVPAHSNLAKVIGAASFKPDLSKEFPILFYRHDGFGNLKKFLIQCRSKTNVNNYGIEDDNHSQTSLGNIYSYNSLRTHELASIGRQILKAICHLHRLKVLHKDIASRNCIVYESKIGDNDRLCVQIMDDSLSRDLFPNDYYCLANNANQPIKWMAVESINEQKFTSASDVYSIGILFWELFACAQQPFADIEPEELGNALLGGVKLSQSHNCPDEIYEIMMACWKLDLNERPTALTLLNKLDKFSYQLSKYV
uniref:Protein kinase domain-containing protein n=1 Tax=Rhabditophanes sp. KR3021 TaxID=114890 RepID=A0AC35TMU3_9BILA